MKDRCYNASLEKKSLDGVSIYASCVHHAKKELLDYETKGKYHLLFMEMASNKADRDHPFDLVAHISDFIEKYKLERNNLSTK